MEPSSVAAGGAPTARRAGDPHRWTGSLFVLLAIVMDLMDTTVVLVALPAVERTLGADSTELQWVVGAYTLTFAVALVTAGRIGDIVGRRRMVLIGIACFTVASVACGLAPTIELLIAGRVLQALSGAFILTQGLSIFQVAFPPAERAKILALFGAVTGFSSMIGPLVGGLLVDADIAGLGWRPIFLINVPLGIITFIGAAKYVRESKSDHPPTLDLKGVALLTVALLAVLYPLVQGREHDWPWWTYALMIASLPVFALFACQQSALSRRGGTPLVQPGLVRLRSFVAGLVVLLVIMSALTSMYFVFTIYLQSGVGFGALETGLIGTISAVATLAAASVSTVLAARFGPRVLTAGAVLMAIGQLVFIWSITNAPPDVTGWYFVPALMVSGAGIGLLVAPAIDIVLERVPVADAGAASGVLNTAEQLGAAIGVAIVGTVLFSRVADAFEDGADPFRAFTTAASGALWVNFSALVLGAVMTYLIPRKRIVGRTEE